MDFSAFSTSSLLNELQRRVRCAEKKTVTRTILIGPPGCGKGTQSPAIKRDYCACHLATGDMLRAAVRNKTPMGMKAKAAMDSGSLVSDDIVIGIVTDNINSAACQKGFILDGFPRTVPQAKKLDEILGENSLTKVIQLDVEDAVVVERIGGRMIHPASGRSYHKQFAPPKVAGKDDLTGEDLVVRKDDQGPTVLKRLGAFRSQTQPVIDYYSSKGLVAKINADQPIKTVYSEITAALGPNN
jgi:adenylate kinase